jgi:acetate kinase
MKPMGTCVLAINCGSSSIRFAVYEAEGSQRLQLGGKIDRIGSTGTNLAVSQGPGAERSPRRISAADHRDAAL